MVVCFDAYPDATAVMVACPGVAVVVNWAVAWACPALIATMDATVPTLISEQVRVTCMPSSGAFAGEPVVS